MLIATDAAPNTTRAAVWFGVACTLMLTPYVSLAFFVHPTADDLTYALTTQRDGYWTAYRDQLRNWNGRFASNFFELGGPMVWGSIAAYRVIAVLMIAGTVASLYAIIRALTRDVWTRSEVAVSALAMTALNLAGLPALDENIYWYTGAVTYQLAPILLVLQVAMTIPLLTGRASPGRMRTVLALGLLVAVAGMTEVAMLLVVVFYAALTAIGAIDGNARLRRVSVVMLITAIGGGLLVWLAPGNAVRSALYPTRHELARSMGWTAIQAVRFTAQWATSGPLLLATLLYIPMGVQMARRSPIFQMNRARARALAAGAFATIPAAVFPAYWETGLLGQHRTLSVSYFVFLVLWFAAVTALLSNQRVLESIHWLKSTGPRLVAVLFILSLTTTRNGYAVAADVMYGRAAAFDREMVRRYELLEACRRESRDSCAVPRLVNKPESFFVLDLSDDPTNWINAAYAGYFHVRAVVATRSENAH
jgi:hypothetical protein